MTAPLVVQNPDPSVLVAEQVALDVGVDIEHGLSAADAAARLERYGSNELRSVEGEPAWRRFLRQFADPLVYLLLVAIVISVAAWVLEGAHSVPVDAVVILVIVLANAVIGFVQENKAADAVAALADMTASHATVLRDGRLTDVASSEIVPGDVLVLAEGDAVGADARLVSAASLRVQEASLTGESEAVAKNPATLAAEAQLGDRTNMVFKGTAVARGVGRAVVTGTGMNTEVGKIATLLDETERDPSPLQVEIAKISRALGILVILIAIGVMAVVAVVNGVDSAQEGVEILLMGVSLAVAAVPEGLPAILSLVLAIGVQAMARRNAVMKNLESVETLGSVSVICSDKTGTLTKNEMTLREIVTASGRVEVSGTGYEPVGRVRVVDGDGPVVLAEARLVLTAGSAASNAQLHRVGEQWQIQGDPTEAAFLVAAPKLDGVVTAVGELDRRGEAPFDSERKMMSVLAAPAGGEVLVLAKGAPDVLLERCVAEQIGDASSPLTQARREEWERVVVELSEQGYRTLGVAWRAARPDDREEFDQSAERDLIFVGIVGIIDPPRQEAAEAIADAHRAGIKTVMITGDHPVTAARIASDLGIIEDGDDTHAVTGHELESMDDRQLSEVVRQTRVFARVSPEHKLRIVDALQANRLIVAMTGDGVNDAPALKSADIGIAMGITGTEVTKEAGEMILGDDNYATIVAAVQRGRVIFDNIKKFIRYLLSSNMGEVATVFFGVVLAGVIGLSDPADPGAAVVPLLATQILWINLVTDSGPALAMGVDPQIDDVMARKPRGTDERIIDRHMWSRIIGIGLVMGVLSLIVYDLTLPGGLLSGMEHLAPVDQQLEVGRTTMFTALVFMQMFNALNSRSDLASAFDHLFTNRWLWISLAAATIAQVLVVNVPALQHAFGTTSITPAHWALAIGAGVAVLVFEEIMKLARRARA
ncbi:MAG: cation-translocating P-type ATPase [Propioniciclava sp.]|uniref:cation-translocating P-type ATPase n=1 Tax=Propioniciclava sp. TaxID=2038686 RepID=UPI0039E2481B